MADESESLEFSAWLQTVLKKTDVDENVFGSYIIGILDDDGSNDEKIEQIDELLSGIMTAETFNLSTSIVEHWKKLQDELEARNNAAANFIQSNVIDEKLVKLMESQVLTVPVQKQCNGGTEEEKRIRQAILAQYSQLSEEEEYSDSDGETHEPKPENSHIERNLNVLAVQQAEKERREQAKMDSQKKKEKDKEDREKQKQMREEKKEKRKTVKGERRR